MEDVDTFSRHAFATRLLDVLSAHPAGLSEFELIRALKTAGQPGFETGCLRDNLSLFQTHFVLFHALYRLRDQLWHEGRAHLSICVLCIQLLPVTPEDDTGTALDGHDLLRDYYLDLGNLKNTDAVEVETLLSQFWKRFICNDQRREALAILELKDPVDWPTIKTRHRRLVMRHHPDRGGDGQRLQTINAALDVLSRAKP
jgi:hypothetical protein